MSTPSSYKVTCNLIFYRLGFRHFSSLGFRLFLYAYILEPRNAFWKRLYRRKSDCTHKPELFNSVTKSLVVVRIHNEIKDVPRCIKISFHDLYSRFLHALVHFDHKLLVGSYQSPRTVFSSVLCNNHKKQLKSPPFQFAYKRVGCNCFLSVCDCRLTATNKLLSSSLKEMFS